MSEKIFRELRPAENMGHKLSLLPLSWIIISYTLTALVLLSVIFLLKSDYSRRTTVKGNIQSSSDVVRLYSQLPGRVEIINFRHGDHVKKNATLATLINQHTFSNQNAEASIENLMWKKEEIIRDEISNSKKITKMEIVKIHNQIDNTIKEISILDNEIKIQEEKTNLQERTKQRHQQLASDGFISAASLQEKEEDLLNEKRLLSNLKRTRREKETSLQDMKETMRSLPSKMEATSLTKEKEIKNNKKELIERKISTTAEIIAPLNGTILDYNISIGQWVETNHPLALILPDTGKLEAQLYVPSKAIGFINKGDKVKIRYEAFPYQKFGHASGLITHIAKAPIFPGELKNSPQQSEPVYKVKVSIEKDWVSAYGKRIALSNGMLLEADILGETRTLLEWLTEPIYATNGKIHEHQ